MHTQYNNTHKITTTIHTSNQQQLHTKRNNLKPATIHTRQIRILQHVQKVKTPKQGGSIWA